MHMSRHTTHDTPFDQYRFTLPHTPRRFRHAVHSIALALTYTHADLPDNIHASFFRLRMSPFGPRDPPLPDSRISARGLLRCQNRCSGRIVPAGCSLHQNRRPGLPHKCGIALIRLPCGSALIGSPQQSMRTKVSCQGCTSCDTQATPKQLQVSRRFHGTPSRYPFSFPLHTSVCEELSCPSHAR